MQFINKKNILVVVSIILIAVVSVLIFPKKERGSANGIPQENLQNFSTNLNIQEDTEKFLPGCVGIVQNIDDNVITLAVSQTKNTLLDSDRTFKVTFTPNTTISIIPESGRVVVRYGTAASSSEKDISDSKHKNISDISVGEEIVVTTLSNILNSQSFEAEAIYLK